MCQFLCILFQMYIYNLVLIFTISLLLLSLLVFFGHFYALVVRHSICISHYQHLQDINADSERDIQTPLLCYLK